MLCVCVHLCVRTWLPRLQLDGVGVVHQRGYVHACRKVLWEGEHARSTQQTTECARCSRAPFRALRAPIAYLHRPDRPRWSLAPCTHRRGSGEGAPPPPKPRLSQPSTRHHIHMEQQRTLATSSSRRALLRNQSTSNGCVRVSMKIIKCREARRRTFLAAASFDDMSFDSAA